MNDQHYRANYIVGLYRDITGDPNVTSNTKIKNTTIWKLCETGGAPYQRIKKWCESKAIVTPDMVRAKKEFDNCFALMQSRNSKYGDSWKQLRVNSIVDLMLMKLDRCQKQALDNKAIEVELEDVVNYGIFGLMNLRK